MDIDLSVLRSLESEKDISLDQAIKAIEDALLVAYHKSEGASRARASRWTGRAGTSPCGPSRPARTAPRSGSTTTPRPGSAGSPPPPPGR